MDAFAKRDLRAQICIIGIILAYWNYFTYSTKFRRPGKELTVTFESYKLVITVLFFLG